MVGAVAVGATAAVVGATVAVVGATAAVAAVAGATAAVAGATVAPVGATAAVVEAVAVEGVPPSAPDGGRAVAVDGLATGGVDVAAGVAGCSEVAEVVTIAPLVEPDDPADAPLVVAAGRAPTRSPERSWCDDGEGMPTSEEFTDAWPEAVVGAGVCAVAALAQRPKSDAVVIAIAPRE
ncbi:MAG: hypothetical protein JOZ95_01300 [Solirubrobacterales bacterium]|nr:hypothetical protein [Solirubrobacterales bacterium]